MTDTTLPTPPSRRRKGLLALTALVLAGSLGHAAYDHFVASRRETTDNAYVQGNLVQITPQVGGTVTAILADDTAFVHAGQPLVKLDPADARVALAQAEAALGQAVRQARTLYANNGSLSAQVALRHADVDKARSEVARTAEDLARRQSIAANGAVSREELQHAQALNAAARSALAAAEAALAAAREQLAANQALTDGTPVQQHPSVLAAAAKVREAWLATQRLALPSPVDGHVARRTVQLGQRVAPGAPLMSIVPLQQLWVDANFKEGQLRKIRIGQPVRLTADLYGKSVEYHGTVAGLAAGTGAAFALLPAQNATGNWIKVVQRVPVRVTLDAAELARHPLRVGLSMDVEVDVRNQDGPMLDDASRPQPGAVTEAVSVDDEGAQALVRRVIAANLGQPAREAEAARAPAPRSASAAAGSH